MSTPASFVPRLPQTPRGMLPARMRVLYVTTPRRAGAWLAEAFASDSACHVGLEETHGAAAGLERLRETAFDAVLVCHQPEQLDALAFVDGLRAGGAEEPLVVLGELSEHELGSLCYEAGADAYVCVDEATTRGMLWTVARATERRHLLRENQRLQRAERQRKEFEAHEAERLLAEQRALARGELDALGALPPADPFRNHYRDLLKTHVVMGSGNLSDEMAALARRLAGAAVTGPQTIELHVGVLEELVRGLGCRGARHVMSRADLLLLELLVQLAEHYRRRASSTE